MGEWEDEVDEVEDASTDWKQTTLPYLVVVGCVLGGSVAGGVVG